jgi:hypothetical protein
MTIELPLFRLGLAGFTAEQQQAIARLLDDGASEATLWELGELGSADAWWLNGARTQALGSDRVRVASGQPGGRSLQLQLPDIDRPLGFAKPLPLGMRPLCSFDLASNGSMKATLRQFETWLAPMAAQFCLAASIVEHQSALGAGTYELCLQSQVLAVVDMQGEAAVRATLGPADFEGTWWRRSDSFRIPDNFARTSLAQLMWQYTLRTQRDILPRHYRTGLLYFRRAPQLPQRLLRDSHLLILRELMLAAATFEELQQRCGFSEARLARELSSLYFVGSITSNRKRAARTAPKAGGGDSRMPHSHFDSAPSELPPAHRPTPSDLTVPAQLHPDC